MERATGLISGAAEQVVEHLRLALALRGRMEGSDTAGRGYDDASRLRSGDLGSQDLLAAVPGDPEMIPLELAPPQPEDVLDALTVRLIECGGVLSQLIAGMVQHRTAGGGVPDGPPVPEVARGLIRDVITGVRRRHSKRDVTVAAKIVAEATEAIATDIFFVSPDLLDAELN